MADLAPPRTLVVACGALVRELRAVLAQIAGDAGIDVVYLPANLHNRPELIPAAVEAVVAQRRADRVFVAYADCGTGGRLDAVLTRLGATRLPGAHCYEFFTGVDEFAALHQRELGTFFLTDFLARHFEALVVQGLGLDRHPELREAYFGQYTRLTLLSQSADPALLVLGRAAATRLGLEFEHVHTGLVPFATAVHLRVA